MKYSKYNIVIIGSGISGLYLANTISRKRTFEEGILVITKDDLFSGSSSLAQGGIVSVIPEINKKDSISSHVKDTIKAGCGINNINTVKYVSEQSSSVIQELIRFGVEFDKNDKNELNFTLEGAHSIPRILHSQGDSTGKVIEEVLCENLKKTKNVDLYDNTTALEILTDENNRARGVIVQNNQSNELEVIASNNIVIATGGIGQIYKETTNPKTSTGDGIALAYNCSAEVENMEFVQFHPSAMYVKSNNCAKPLVSESLRGEGAKLVDIDGNYFAKDYDARADLAPRDIVSRAIVKQMEITSAPYVNLDILQIGIEKFKRRFPTIANLCRENNIDIESGLIPVRPAQHYFMGGIKVNLESETTIKNLYAIGECASTGLHGANRLASNSLLECCVFAQVLCDKFEKANLEPPKKMCEKIKKEIDKYTLEDTKGEDENKVIEKLFNELKETMTQNVAIVRCHSGLTKALEKTQNIQKELDTLNAIKTKEYYELQNALCVAKLVINAAIMRKNSIGAHFRQDYPHESLNLTKERKINYEQILA